MKRRMIALVLILVLVLGALAGCGGKTEEPTDTKPAEQPSQTEKEPEKDPEPVETGHNLPTTGNKEKNALTTSITEMPRTLDQYYHQMGLEMSITMLLVDTLYRYDENNNPIPWVATSIEPNEDGTEVMITLRDDVYFRDGTKMTAEDIAFSFDHMHLAQGDILEQSTTREVIDDTHLKLVFDDSGNSFYNTYDNIYGCVVLNSAYYKANYENTNQDFLFDINSCGPYDLDTVDATTGTVVLKKWDKYWGDRGYFDTITERVISGDTTMAFESGDIDFSTYTSDSLATIEDYDNIQVEIKLSPAIIYLALNSSSASALNDIRVREAATYAIDRDELAQIATSFSGVTAWNLVSPDMNFYHDFLPHRLMDQDRSRNLMTEAGYSASNPCSITLLMMNQPGWAEALQALKEELDACYFDCTIVTAVDLTPYEAGDFDIGIMGMGLGGVFNYMVLYYDENFAGLNFCHYEGDDLAEIISEFGTATTQEEADKAMLHDDSLFTHIPLGYPATIYVFNGDLDVSEAFLGNTWDISFFKWKK